jgi:hypothetical protein
MSIHPIAEPAPAVLTADEVEARVEAGIDSRLHVETFAQWGVQVTVVGATSGELLPAPGDPGWWVELLGVLISVSGATTVTMTGGNSGFEHTFFGAASVWMNASDLTTLSGGNVLYRVGNVPIVIAGSGVGVTIKATPRYRTNGF